MTTPLTVGEMVERDGYSELMMRMADLAEAVGRLPVGEWDYAFVSDPRWRLLMNGGTQETWTPEAGIHVPRFHGMLFCDGWPVACVNAAGGTVAAGQEDEAIAAVEAEIEGRVEAPS